MEISLVGLLVGLLVFCLIFWAARRIMAATQVGEPVVTIVYVVLVVVFAIYLLSFVGGIGPRISLR